MTKVTPKKITATMPRANSNSKVPRKPPHCSKCPGNPRRSQCTHTAKGRQFIFEQQARAQFPGICAETIPSPPVSTDTDPTRSGLTITIRPPKSVEAISSFPPSQSSIAPVLTTPPERRSASESVGQWMIDPSLVDSSTVEPQATFPHVRIDDASVNIVVDPVPPVEPFASLLLTPSQRNDSLFTPQGPASFTFGAYSLNTVRTPNVAFVDNISPLQASSSIAPSLTQEMANHNENLLSSSSLTQSQTSSNNSPPARRNNKKRATAKNPIYGRVTGVLRGASSAHEIYRTHEAPLPIEKSSAASKVFLESMNSIFTKCEDVSLKTGCWLFVGAQHANALGGALHYASPRLRKDGRQETNDFASKFLHLLKNVSDSRKVDVLELQGQLRKTQQEMSVMQESKIDAEARLQAALTELETLKTTNQQKIQGYRATLGLPA